MYWIVMDEMTSDCIYFHLMLFRNIWKLVFLNMNNKTTNPDTKRVEKNCIQKVFIYKTEYLQAYIHNLYYTANILTVTN